MVKPYCEVCGGHVGSNNCVCKGQKMSNVMQAIHQSQMDVAFESIALDALTPLLQASDAGRLIIPPDVWQTVRLSVKQRIAETYFGTSDRLPVEVE